MQVRVQVKDAGERAPAERVQMGCGVKQYITRVRKVSTEFKSAGGNISESELADIAVHGVMHRPEFMSILTSHVTPGQGIQHTCRCTHCQWRCIR